MHRSLARCCARPGFCFCCKAPRRTLSGGCNHHALGDLGGVASRAWCAMRVRPRSSSHPVVLRVRRLDAPGRGGARMTRRRTGGPQRTGPAPRGERVPVIWRSASALPASGIPCSSFGRRWTLRAQSSLFGFPPGLPCSDRRPLATTDSVLSRSGSSNRSSLSCGRERGQGRNRSATGTQRGSREQRLDGLFVEHRHAESLWLSKSRCLIVVAGSRVLPRDWRPVLRETIG